MTCPDCATAATQLWHAFSAACRGCMARMLSRGPAFAESKRAGRICSRYRAMLGQLGLTHEEVKRAAAMDWMQGARAA